MKLCQFISKWAQVGRVALPILLVLPNLSCSGKAQELLKGDSLGAPVIGDGGTRSDGNNFGEIYTVTNIVEATSDIPEWTNADLPFTGPRRQLGQAFSDSQWPFKFTFSYPSNNYKLSEAHVVLTTQRDNSDTEGIFVDGVMTGRPPSNMISGVSPNILHRYYACTGCAGATIPSSPSNTYFMDFAMTHYKIATPNSYDLDLANLLTPTTLKPSDLVNDGVLRVVTGDDSMAQSNTATTSLPLLFLEGFTVSTTPLTCVDSPSYKLINTYIHNDGNSIGQAAFSGTVLRPDQSWSTANNAFRSVELYYDVKLPKISDFDNLTMTKGELRFSVKRDAGLSAIVINGIGISESGFDQSQATSGVETWENAASTVAEWNNFLSPIPADGSTQVKVLNLVNLLGASRFRDLLAQGKLNISIAGGLATVYGSAATSTRTFGVAVNGAELVLEGNYFTQVCEVPDNTASPLSDAGGAVGSCDLDQTSPVASSIQVASITSNSATIQWLTNEPADSQVGYGIGNTSTLSGLDATATTFHSVTLTGLAAYKYYQFLVKTRDGCGNLTLSGAQSFRTLR